jgi:transposase InsO family protein
MGSVKDEKKYKEGPDRLAVRLKMSRSTVYQLRKRYGEHRLFAEQKKEKTRHYEKKEPGSFQMDLKQTPALGGRRFKYQVSILDDCTRYVAAEIFDKKTTKNITTFASSFLERFPFEVKEIATDNGWEFTMRYTLHKKRKTLFEKELAKRGIKHRLINPRHSQTNGKVERFHRTVDEELYRVKRFIDEEHRTRELKKYLERYNSKRIHLGIKGMTPEQKLNMFLEEKCYQVA